MELTGKRVAVLAEDHYENLELWYPVLRLREAGAQVTIVGPKAGEAYKSKEGYPAKADLSMDDARAADFDAVIVPGGYAPDRMRRHQAMLTLVREAFQSGKVVAAICHDQRRRQIRRSRSGRRRQPDLVPDASGPSGVLPRDREGAERGEGGGPGLTDCRGLGRRSRPGAAVSC